jgi:hypothetical protein
VRQDGHVTADLQVDVDEWRNRLALTFKVANHNPDMGACATTTELLVVPDMIANTDNPENRVHVVPGQNLPLTLPSGSVALHLDVVVSNPQDANCVVDVGISSARLTGPWMVGG